jgi:cytochrome b6
VTCRGALFTPFKEILATERERTVPGHLGVPHYLGALALLLLLVETATGILLMIYYRPSAAAAYSSTAILNDVVHLGWLMRSVHRWGADLLILIGFLHLFRVYFSRAYQSPRQLNWLTGVALLIVIITMGFTGTLLPWDQYAYWYMDSARQTLANVPVLGNAVLAFIWGGWELGGEVLLRFYALHVGVLPWLGCALLGAHLYLVWHFGIQEPAGKEAVGPALRTPLPDFLATLFMVGLIVGGCLLSLAVAFPAALLEQANPLVPLAHPQPRWYLLPVRELLRSLPEGAANVTVAGFALLLLCVPLLDRGPKASAVKQAVRWLLGGLVLAGWILLGVKGYLE